jgi:hypothetical protein
MFQIKGDDEREEREGNAKSANVRARKKETLFGTTS